MDASVASVFADIEKRWQKLQANMAKDQVRAGRLIERESQRMGRGLGRGLEDGARRGRRALSDLERGFQQLARVAEREMMRQARAQQRAAEEFARRTSHRTTRFLMPNMPLGSVARRAASDLARGAGIDFTLGGGIQRARDLQTQSVALSNSGYIRLGEGIQTQRVDPRALAEEARAVGDKFAIDPGSAMGGLQSFVGKTGDLATARALLEDMARLSVATGTSLDDMISAAGDVSGKLGDPAKSLAEAEDRAKAVASVMEVIAGQGKLGAVEIKDLSVQMARVAGNAGDFEGDRSQNIIKMGALAQLARQGTATSAADAARSVSALGNTFRKNARIAKFEEAGVNIFSDEGRTTLRDPFEIIKDSLKATEGDIPKLNAMFMDTLGAKAVATLSRTYKDAGGGDAGMAAIDKLVASLTTKAVVSREEQDESVGKVMNTTAAQVQLFQNQMDKVSDELMMKLLPAFQEASPHLINFAKVLGDVATWTLENPKKAIGIAISASIARAGIESSLRTAIERTILGGDPGGQVHGRGTKVANAAAGLGNAMLIASLAVTTLTVGTAIIDSLFDKSQEEQKQRLASDIEGFNKVQGLSSVLERSPAEALGVVRERMQQNEGQIASIEGDQGGILEGFMRALGAAGDFLGGDEFKINESLDAKQKSEDRVIEQLRKENADLVNVMKAIESRLAGGINVNNMPSAPREGVVSAL